MTGRIGTITWCCVAWIALPWFIGCGGGDVGPTGFVKFDDGEPVRSGGIEFRSLSDGARYAGRIAADGSFTLTNRHGKPTCPAGRYQAVVVQIVLTEDLVAEAHTHGRTVPRRYADYQTSGLTVTRSIDDQSPLEIILQSSP